MKQILSDKKIMIILGIAFALRILFFIFYVICGGTGYADDTVSYLAPAYSLVQNLNFTGNAARTPGYPIILAFFILIAKDGYYICTVLFQITMNVASIYYLYRLCVLITGSKRAGIIAAIIASVNFLDIFYSYFLLTDSISQSLMLIGVYYCAEYLVDLPHDARLSSLVMAALFLAASISIRPALMYLPLALSAGFIFVAIIKKEFKRIVAIILCIAIIPSTVVYIWTMRNMTVAGYNGYSTVSAINLYQYNSCAVYAKQHNMSYYEAHSILCREDDEVLQDYMKEMPKYEAYTKRGMEIIKSDIPYYVRCCLLDCVYLTIYPGVLSFESISSSIDKAKEQIKNTSLSFANMLFLIQNTNLLTLSAMLLDVVCLGLLFLLFVIGFIFCFKKKWIYSAFLGGIILYVYVVCSQPVGIGAYSRFRISVSMYTLVFAAYAIDIISQKIATRVKEIKMRKIR